MYATITDRQLMAFKGAPTLEQMQAAVGGYIETVFRVDSPCRKGVEIDVYANEEGLLIGLPIDHINKHTGYPIAGNIVITASKNGNTIEATPKEIEAALPFIGRLAVSATPEMFGLLN